MTQTERHAAYVQDLQNQQASLKQYQHELKAINQTFSRDQKSTLRLIAKTQGRIAFLEGKLTGRSTKRTL